MAWALKSQEQPGDYWFSGKCFVTNTVSSSIPLEDVQTILIDLHAFVKQEQGVDYLQVYINEATKQELWIIDQVTKNDLQEGNHPEEHNYNTILFPDEY